jgi:hypothetical protein
VLLGSLAVLAALLVGLLVALTGHGAEQRHTPVAQDVPVQSALPSTSSASSAGASRAKASPARRSRTAHSAAAVPGDTGRLLQALNGFRARHGVHPVSGRVTGSAIGCAAREGDAAACPSSYFWEPVPRADGRQVVEKIARHPNGTDFLLDPRIKRVEIGWKSAGSGLWECALVATY